MRPALLFAICCLSLVFMSPTVGYAQTARGRVPITLAIVDSLPNLPRQADAVVMRSRSMGDVIVLTEKAATPELLDAATRTLLHSRLSQGFRPTGFRGKQINSVMLLGVRRSPAPSGWLEAYGGRLDQLLAAAKSAPVGTVEELGTARTVKFYPPLAQRRRSGQ
jgi:hypothetical protein